mmetsp:Transcript_64142/g.73620  ORF Transcript_64142/g.73620 Transcript_64142/m.73620 type:complete len:189 (+) Transcript_64142:372-938(+)
MPKSSDRSPTIVDHKQCEASSSPCRDDKQGKPRRKVNYKVKYKTEICKSWELNGSCPFSDKCAFAHGFREIRSKIHVPANYKTKPCTQFHERGFCKFGSRCQFRHEAPGCEEVPEKVRSISDPEPYTGASFSYREHLKSLGKQLSRESPALLESSTLSSVLTDAELSYASEEVPRPRLQFFRTLTCED